MRRAIVHVAAIITACFLSTTSIYAAKETPKPKGTLEVKAAIVYRLGPQAVARQKFYLLDTDFDEIYEKASGKDVLVLPVTANWNAVFSAVGGKSSPHVVPGIVESSIKDHVIAAATSDFEGHISFKDIPVGSYFLVGMTLTRTDNQFVFWNLPVSVKPKNEELLISQDEGFVSDSIYATKTMRGSGN